MSLAHPKGEMGFAYFRITLQFSTNTAASGWFWRNACPAGSSYSIAHFVREAPVQLNDQKVCGGQGALSTKMHKHLMKNMQMENTLPARCSPSDKPPQPAKISRVARQFSGVAFCLSEPACSSSEIYLPSFFFAACAFLVKVMSLTFVGSWLKEKTCSVNYLKQFLTK